MPSRARKDEESHVTAHDADAAAPRTDSKTADSKAEDRPGPVEPKDSGTEYLNVTTGPLVYTQHGHMVGGGEWTPAVNLDRIGRQARDRGYLKPRSAL